MPDFDWLSTVTPADQHFDWHSTVAPQSPDAKQDFDWQSTVATAAPPAIPPPQQPSPPVAPPQQPAPVPAAPQPASVAGVPSQPVDPVADPTSKEFGQLPLEEQRDRLIADHVANPVPGSSEAIGRIMDLFAKRIKDREDAKDAAIYHKNLQLSAAGEVANHPDAIGNSFIGRTVGRAWAGVGESVAGTFLTGLGAVTGSQSMKDAAEQVYNVGRAREATNEYLDAGSETKKVIGQAADMMAQMLPATVIPGGGVGTLASMAAYFGSTTAAKALTEAQQRGDSPGSAYGQAAAHGLVDAAWTLFGGSLGSGLSRLSGVEGAGALGKAANWLGVRVKLPSWAAVAGDVAEGTLVQVAQGIGMSASHYLTDVAGGKREFDRDEFVSTMEAGIASAAVAGLAGGSIHAGVEHLPAIKAFLNRTADVVEKRENKMPAVAEAISDAQEFKQTATPKQVEKAIAATSRVEFERVTGTKGTNREQRQAYQDELQGKNQELATAADEQGGGAVPDTAGPRLLDRPKTDQEKAIVANQNAKDIAALRKKGINNGDLDRLESVEDPETVRSILDHAAGQASDENEKRANLRDQYEAVFGQGKRQGLVSARAAKSAARGGDETSVVGYDHIADMLREPGNAELASEVSKRGYGDIESGILPTLAGGQKQFADVHPTEYLRDLLDKHAPEPEQPEAIEPPVVAAPAITPSIADRVVSHPDKFGISIDHEQSPGVGGLRIDQGNVEKVFPGAKVRQTSDSAWRVTLKGGHYADVVGVPNIHWTPEISAKVRKNYPHLSDAEWHTAEVSGLYELVGKAGERLPVSSLIALSEAKGADESLLRHESIHWAKQLGLFSEAEWKALADRYAKGLADAGQVEEAVAMGLQSHNRTSIGYRIKAFFKKMLAAVGIGKITPDVRNVISDPDFWKRGAGDVVGGTPKFSVEPTSTKNDYTDRSREERGERPVAKHESESFEHWDEQARSILAAKPGAGADIVYGLLDHPRPIDRVETAVLTRHTKAIEDMYNGVRKEIAALPDGESSKRTELENKKSILQQELDVIGHVNKQVAGYELGAGLVARKMGLDGDGSLSKMMQAEEEAQGVDKLSPDEQAKVEDVADKAAELQKEFEDAKAVDEGKATQTDLGSANKRSRAAHVELAGEAAADKASDKPALTVDDITSKIGPDATAVELSNAARELAKHFIRSGFTTRDVIVDKVHEVLAGLVPGLDRRTTMDAISLYGQFKALNKDPVAVKLRETAGELQQIGKLLDIQQGKAPLKTGMERRTPTDEERRLTKLVNEYKKKYGIEVTDPAKQLQSAIGAMKTRRSNRIKDLKQEIADRKQVVKTKTAIPEDAESLAMQQELDQLQAEHKAIFGDPKLSDAQRLAAAQKAAERELAEYQRRIDERDLADKPKRPPLEDANLFATKLLLESARQQFNTLRAADPANQQKASAIANQRLRAKLTDDMVALSRKLRIGDFEPNKKSESQLKLSPETLAIKAKRDAMLADWRSQVDAKQKRRTLIEQKAELDRQLTDGNFNLPAARETIEQPRDIKELQKQVNERRRIVRNAIEDADKSVGAKAAEKWLKIRRAFVLSSPMVFAKLAAAASVRVAISPVREAVGGAISAAIPRLADMAPREGGFSVRAEAKAYSDMLKNSFNDSIEILKTERSPIDLLAGKAGLPPEAIGFFGRIHSALKTPAKRHEFTLSIEKRTAAAIKHGLDPLDTAVQMGIYADAYKDANRSIFLQDNRVVSAYKAVLKILENKNPETGRVPLAGKAGAVVTRTLLPIVTVPTNMVGEIVSHSIGAIAGPVEVARAYARGVETLKPAEADAIMRHLKDGSMGAAVMAIGYFGVTGIGGYYQPGKQNKKDIEPGEVRIFGINIPPALLHNPLLEMLQVGATIRHVMDSKLRVHDTEKQDLTAGLAAAAVGIVKEVPFVREVTDLDKLLDPYERPNYAARMAGDLAVPQAVSQIARFTDKDQLGETIKRKPESLIEGVKANIPGLRQQVPRAKR